MEKYMNWDQVEGNWEQFKGKVKETWGKLTDDDISTIKGQQQVLQGKIQERYGYAKDVAEKEIEKFVGKYEKSSKEYDACCSKTKVSSCDS